MDNGFAPTETECRLAEVRSRSMSCNCMTRTSQQECRGILELLIGFNFAMEFYLKYTLLINCQD
ncbi:hypothetical protein GPK61_08800 [Dorea formicigenerans]|nr:hypothetical protein [Dorea formicigenerans]